MTDNGLGTTLRDAVDFANTSQDAEDTIKFDPNVFANGGTIELSQGQLSITEPNKLIIDATVDGPGGSEELLDITIVAAPFSRIFNITGGVTSQVEINGLVLTGGNVFNSGGAISSNTNLIVKNSLISGNSSQSSGGAISASGGNLTIDNSTISGNSAGGVGGVVFAAGTQIRQLTVVSSTVSGNTGGGIEAVGSQVSASIQSSVITGNSSSGEVGGIFFIGRNLSVQSSEFRNNTGGDESYGGGLFARATDGSITISESIFDDNRSGAYGAGGGAFLRSHNSSVTITNTIVSNNKALGIEANVGGIGIIARASSNVVIEGLTVTANHADDDIGGILIQNGDSAVPSAASVVTVRNSTISGNTASHNNAPYEAAAGVWLEARDGGSNTIEYSTISNNRIITGPDEIKQNVPGGGLFILGYAETKTTIRNSTISGNEAEGSGGGIKISQYYGGGQVFIEHSTITNNWSDSDGDGQGTGGGIHVGVSGTTVTIDHTIIAENFRGSGSTRDDIDGVVEAAWSLIGDNAGTTLAEAPVGSPDANGNLVGTSSTPIDPKLGPLVYNGGPVFLDDSGMLTHALLPGSPAVNAGDPSFNPDDPDGNLMTDDALPYDQRGNPWFRVDNVSGRIDIGAIEWQLNPLPGDYNFNGVVDAADYVVWRDTLGSTSDLRADGDNDGVIDADDYSIWQGGFGQVIADGNASGATDIADYNLWVSAYGSTTDLRADYNDNGIVDDADFDIWFDTFGSTMEIAQFGLLSSWFDPDAPPSVVGVALSLTGVQGMDFAGKVGSGEQLRSVPLIAANTLHITFNHDVVVTQSDLEIVNLDGSSPTVFGFSYDTLAQTATWTFTSSLADGRYLVRLSDSVETSEGEALDGDFRNPISLGATGTSTFPSGDGDAGGEFRFRFTVLSDDSDHDNIDGATDYQNWKSVEPGMIIVSTSADEFDADLSFGDVSLREAVDYVNNAGTAMSIQLPAGRYTLSRTGTESTEDVALNDLDIFGDVTIIGAGAGVSVIDNSGLSSAPSAHKRTFTLEGAGVGLRLSGLTVANGPSSQTAQVAVASNGATIEIHESAINNHTAYAGASAILITSANLIVSRSVFTNNDNTSIMGGTAIQVNGSGGAPSSIEVGESIFALNSQPTYSGGTTHVAITVYGAATKVNHGKNLYDYAGGGFFNTTPGVDDYLGTPDYVVTSMADTFDHSDDLEALSLREAIDLANQASGTQEIWVPAWTFTLTRDRGSNSSDTDISYGDLDITDSVVIRGIADRTRVSWKPNVTDKVFDLLGDYNDDGIVAAADYTVWMDQNGYSGAYEQYSADGDDDGDVDADDYDIWAENYGNTLELADIAL